MPRIKLHNIYYVSEQALLRINMGEKKVEFLPSVLYALREGGISIPFIIHSIDQNGNFAFTLATAQHHLDGVRLAFQEGLDLLPSTQLWSRGEVALITLYGPHFGEIPGIASRILSTLAADGVKVLAMSASLNSSLLIVPQGSLSIALHSLNRVFEIPSK